MSEGEAPFHKLSHESWQLAKDGYIATVWKRGSQMWVRITNPSFETVDEGPQNTNPFGEARWRLDSAIAAGE